MYIRYQSIMVAHTHTGTHYPSIIYNISKYRGKLERPHCDLTASIVFKGIHPQVAELCRLVTYHHLPIHVAHETISVI